MGDPITETQGARILGRSLVLQGVEMGHPSQLRLRAEKENGTMAGSWGAGSRVMVTEGFIETGWLS